jgi:ferrous iron transport protein A
MSVGTLAQLKKGDTATIVGFHDPDIGLKLLEMGIFPGVKIKLRQIAPLGCPVAIELDGHTISLRKREATTVEVDQVAG